MVSFLITLLCHFCFNRLTKKKAEKEKPIDEDLADSTGLMEKLRKRRAGLRKVYEKTTCTILFVDLWRFVSVAGHKIRLQIEKSPFLDTVPGLHHKKPAEVRLDKKDVIMRLKRMSVRTKNERAYTKMRKIKGEYRIRRGYKSNTTVH